MEQNQVEVEVLTQVVTAQYGTLNAGDTLRTSSAFAEHLVAECGAAAYVKRASAPTRSDGSGQPGELTPSAGVQTSAQEAERAAMELLTAAVTGAAYSAGDGAAVGPDEVQTSALAAEGPAQAESKVAAAGARKRASAAPKEG